LHSLAEPHVGSRRVGTGELRHRQRQILCA
jgi:hypothetical protein